MTARMRTKFAMVPTWVYTQVTDAATLRLYVHLSGEYCDEDRYCFPSEERLAEELGYSERTIRRAIKALRDVEALVVHRSRKTSGHWGRNSYTLPLDDPRDTAMHHHRTPVAAGSDQGKQGISAGRDQRPLVSSGQRPLVSYREPDPLKQPDPGFEPDPSTPKSTHSEIDISPSTRGVDAASTTPSDRHDEDPTAPVKAGVQPPTRQDEEDKQPEPVPPDLPVGNQDSRDDLGDLGGSDPPEPYSPGSAQRQRDFYAKYPEILDWDKAERSYDLVEEHVGGLDAGEATAVWAMLERMSERDGHWLKAANTILKQRELGYVS